MAHTILSGITLLLLFVTEEEAISKNLMKIPIRGPSKEMTEVIQAMGTARVKTWFEIISDASQESRGYAAAGGSSLD